MPTVLPTVGHRSQRHVFCRTEKRVDLVGTKEGGGRTGLLDQMLLLESRLDWFVCSEISLKWLLLKNINWLRNKPSVAFVSSEKEPCLDFEAS